MQPAHDGDDHQSLSHDAAPRVADGEPVPTDTRQDQPAKNQDASSELSPSTWSWRDTLGLVFDGVVSIATVIGVVFLILQWGQTESALDEAKEANRLVREAAAKSDEEAKQQELRYAEQFRIAKGTAQAARDSADAARSIAAASEQQARAAARAAELSERTAAEAAAARRPKLQPFGFKLAREPDDDGTNQTIAVTWFIENSGESAALNASVRAFVAVSTPEFPRPVWRPVRADHPTVVYPHRKDYRLDLSIEIDSLGTKTYRAGKAHIYLRQLACYEDETRRRYWVESCVFHRFGQELALFSFCSADNAFSKDEKDGQRECQP